MTGPGDDAAFINQRPAVAGPLDCVCCALGDIKRRTHKVYSGNVAPGIVLSVFNCANISSTVRVNDCHLCSPYPMLAMATRTTSSVAVFCA